MALLVPIILSPLTHQTPTSNRAHTTNNQPRFPSLDGGGVLDWNNGLWSVILDRDGAGLTWHQWLSLQVDVGAVSLGLGLEGGVGLDTANELLTGTGEGDVLNAEVDTLLDVAVLDLLVDDDTDGGLGNVVNDTGLSVVDLVWHTMRISACALFAHFPFQNPNLQSNPFQAQICGCSSSIVSDCEFVEGLDFRCDSPLLDSTVGLDVDDISNLVCSQVGRQLDHTLFPP